MAEGNINLSFDRTVRNWTDSAGSWPEDGVAAAGLLFFFIAWSVFGAVLEADKSLHYDILEAYAWGKEFQLGYNQHGPFWAWVAGVWFLIFPKTNTSFAVLEALNATLGVWGAWRLIGLFATGLTRHAAALLLVATPFYTMFAFKYNANTIFLSLWPWTLYFFVKSVDRLDWRDAIGFGLFAATCMLSKYYSVILLLTCAIALLFHPNGRRYLFSSPPWIAGATFSVCVLPHLIWSLNAAAPPVAYAMALTGQGWMFSLTYGARLFLDSLINLSGVILVIALARFWRDGSVRREPVQRLPNSRRHFLTVLALAPLFLTFGFGLVFQLKVLAIMAVGTFPLFPLLLMQWAAPLDARRLFWLSAAVAVAVTAGSIAAAPVARVVMAGTKDGPSFTAPRWELAQRVTAMWRAETGRPLRFVGGEAHYANGISFYSDDHPSSLVDLSYAKALWVTPDKLRRDGLAIACAHDDAQCLERAKDFLSGNWKRTSVELGRTIGSRVTPKVAFDIFIVPPASQ